MAEGKVKTTVVGGGLVGSLQALMLAKNGFTVDLYESRPDIRKQEHVTGRSINLALSVRGREALKIVGLETAVLNSGIPMYARMIHSVSGKTSSQPYGKRGQCIYSVDRRKLNELLLTEAEKNGNVTLHFDSKLIRASIKEKELVFQSENQHETVKTDFIFGCDGAHSTVRRQMMRWSRLNYKQEYIEHGYKELRMPPTEDGRFAMPENYLHIWPRNEFMMIGLPNRDCSFTLTMFMPFKIFDTIETEEDLLAFFMKFFPDSVDKIGVENLVHDFFHNQTCGLVSVKCYPHFMANSTLIIGDAAHAVVPFYGQGMNAGFEDCLIFHEHLVQVQNDLVEAASRYADSHWKDTHAIADLSMYNYLEMRSHVNSYFFLAQKYLDNLLHTVFPNTYIPLYTMVGFTRIPYHEVIQRNLRQRSIVNKFLLFGSIFSVITLGVVMFKHSKSYIPLRYRILPCVVACIANEIF